MKFEILNFSSFTQSNFRMIFNMKSISELLEIKNSEIQMTNKNMHKILR